MYCARPIFQPPLTMWERAKQSGGLDNPGRKAKKAKTVHPKPQNQPPKSQPAKMSAAERRHERVQASLAGTTSKAPLIPADPYLQLNFHPPDKPRTAPKSKQPKHRAPLLPADPAFWSSPAPAPPIPPPPPYQVIRSGKHNLSHLLADNARSRLPQKTYKLR